MIANFLERKVQYLNGEDDICNEAVGCHNCEGEKRNKKTKGKKKGKEKKKREKGKGKEAKKGERKGKGRREERKVQNLNGEDAICNERFSKPNVSKIWRNLQ